jgi:hypothetical protein
MGREVWQEIEDFPGYAVSDQGRVLNEDTGNVLKCSPVRFGTPTVGLFRDGVQYRRSVSRLVAVAWLPVPDKEYFNTPTHLDGNRQNCCADNLAWRPRWFAIAYHQERNENRFNDWKTDFILVETGEVFQHPRDCATKYGMLQKDIFMSLIRGNDVFPQWFTFRWS